MAALNKMFSFSRNERNGENFATQYRVHCVDALRSRFPYLRKQQKGLGFVMSPDLFHCGCHPASSKANALDSHFFLTLLQHFFKLSQLCANGSVFLRLGSVVSPVEHGISTTTTSLFLTAAITSCTMDCWFASTMLRIAG
jgi:hypothetical protein